MKMDAVLTEVLDRLSEKTGKQVSLIRTDSVGGGCIHHAARLITSCGDFFLKWNSNCPSDLFVREAECLIELRKAGIRQLVVPEVILAKETNNTFGFLLLEFLESGHSPGTEEDSGIGLASLHRVIHHSFGFYHNNYCGSTLQDNRWHEKWTDFFARQRLEDILNQITEKRGLSGHHHKLFGRLIQKIPGLLPESAVPSLIHGDLWSGNFMQTRRGPALIDPACYYADREMEMGIMTLFGGFSQRFWSAYNDAYPLAPGWRERNRLYQLYHILNHYLIFGGSYLSSAVDTAHHFVGKL